MSLKRLDYTRKALTTILVAALAATLSYAISSMVVHHTALSEFQLASGVGFSIRSTVDASYTPSNEMCSGMSALLYPGTQRCLDLVVTNPLTVPLTVTSLTVTGVTRSESTITHTSCTPTGATFTFGEIDFSGSLLVEAKTTASVGRPLAWKSNGTQDPCEGATFTFTYTGTATFTDATTTVVTATPATQAPGEPVTLAVTVSGKNPAADAHTPTGTIGFYLLTSACSTRDAIPFGSVPVSGGTADLSTSTLPVGTDCIQAIYQDTGADFSASTSDIVHVKIGSGSTKIGSGSTKVKTATTLTLLPDPSKVGQPLVFTATVTGAAGTPTGTVSFYLCSSETNPTTCTTELGTATIDTVTQGASLEHTFTTAGTYYIEAAYPGTLRFTASASFIFPETVTSVGTMTTLTYAPDPPLLGQSVTLTATLRTTSGAGTPSGTVTFSLCNTASCQTTTALGAKSLSGGKATISIPTPPAGTHRLYATYEGTPSFETSRSSVITQVVLAPPSVCAPGGYTNYVDEYSGSSGSPYSLYDGLFESSPVVTGTNGNDFIYLPQGSFVASGLNGDDCIYAGTGDEWLFDGTGNDGVQAGNGTNQLSAGNGADKVLFGTGAGDGVTLGNGTDMVTVGNGRADQVTVGNGTGDTLKVGNGTGDVVHVGSGGHDSITVGKGNDTVRVGSGNSDHVIVGSGNDTVLIGNGSKSKLSLGNGNDTVTVGKGSKNTVKLGSGTDTVILRGRASSDRVTAGGGNETVDLGAGTNNTYTGTSKTKDVCHLPKPPTSHHGSTPMRYYDDTVTRCTVVETP